MTTPWNSSATSITRSSIGSTIVPLDLLGDDVGTRDLQLVALAPHHLDQNRQLQLAAAEHFHLLRRVGRLDPDGDVAEQLLVEAILDLPRGDELALASGHRRRVDAEDHRHRRLVDRDGRHRLAMLDIGNRLADRDVLDAGEADDVAGGRLVDVDPLEPLEGEELGDLRLLKRAVELAHGHRVADPHASLEHASDRDPPEVVVRIEVGDENLQRPFRIAARRRHVIDDRVEQRPEIPARLLQRQRSRCQPWRSCRAPGSRAAPRWRRDR